MSEPKPSFAAVPLRAKTAADIPQMLRALANDVENGVVLAEAVICIVEESPEEPPRRYLWGASRPRPHCAGLCMQIAQWFLRCEDE